MNETAERSSGSRWEWPSSRTVGDDDGGGGSGLPTVARLRTSIAGGARYAGDRARTAVSATATQVQQRPWTAVGAVLAVGIALGWLAASLASERRDAGAFARLIDGVRSWRR
jgi:hypothetical protein